VPIRKNLSVVVCAAFAAAAVPAFAFDPSLHAVPPEQLMRRAGVALPGIDTGDTFGVSIAAIMDIGPQVRSPDAGEPPEDLWQRIRAGFAMPNLDGPIVVERQAWYAARPQQINIMAERSRRYLFHIVEEIERRGMPTELALLPMVESAFNPMAYSPAKASGLWQFIPSTGKNYNLDQNWWYDGRRDIVASTTAALDYLQKLYDMFGDWHLVLASYNWGEGAVSRAVERNRAKGLPTDYASLDMPNETRYYVPKLQAIKNLVLNPAASGIELAPIPNVPYFVTVTLTRDIDLRVAARLADMPLDELIKLNPGHNRPVVSTAVAPTLVLPSDRADVFARNLEQADTPLSSWQTYTLRPTDRIEKLAEQYGLTVSRLKAINGYGANAKIAAGTQILLPLKGADATPLPGQFQPPANTGGRTVTYRVKRGDTVASIARALQVSAAAVQRAAGAKLAVGENLAIAASAAPGKTAAKSSTTRKSAPPAKPAQFAHRN
jgi:membrane-bound lytic murein transglycosylase D